MTRPRLSEGDPRMSEQHATEQELREAAVPSLSTTAEVAAYIDKLTERPHDYATCVYAMSMAAVAAYQHVASKLGVTGFQASMADMDILRRTRGLEAGILLNFDNALYPQYDLQDKLARALSDARPWLAEKAAEKLAEGRDAVPSVIAHWQRLADAA